MGRLCWVWKTRLRHWYSHERLDDAAVPVLPDVMKGRVGWAGTHVRLRTRVQGRDASLAQIAGEVVFQRWKRACARQ
jgi:hypothetical protein